MTVTTISDAALARSLLLERRNRTHANYGDRAYILYLAALVTLTVMPPVIGGLVFAARELDAAGLPVSAGPTVAVLTPLAVLAARLRGPVSATLPEIDLLLPSPLDRAAIRRRSRTLWLVGSALLGCGAGVIGEIVATGGMPRPGAVLDVLAWAGTGVGLFGWYAAAQWAFATAARRGRRGIAATMAVGAGVVALVGLASEVTPVQHLVNPAGWGFEVAALGGFDELALLVATMTVAAQVGLAWLVARACARAATREFLREQAWTARTLSEGAVTLNTQLVAEAVVRERNRVRTLPLRQLPRWLPAGAARDVLGAIRRWPRSLAAVVMAGSAAALLALAPSTPALWGVGGILLTAAGRVAALGLRRHADNTGRATQLEPQNLASVSAHVMVPGLLVFLGTTIGLIVAAALTSAPPPVVAAILLASVIAVVIQVVPAYAVQLPIWLIGPVITPAGDLSGLLLIAWTMRAHLCVAAATAMILGPAAEGSVVGVSLWGGAWLVLVALWSARVFRREAALID